MIAIANKGLQKKPYCTVPAVSLPRKMAMTVKRQPQYGTKIKHKVYQSMIFMFFKYSIRCNAVKEA